MSKDPIQRLRKDGVPVPTAERRIKIFNLLVEKKSVEVNELANRFGVSTMTIRRDLAMLEKQGIVTTNYGGAYLNEGTAIEPSFSLKYGQMTEAKNKMGLAAADLVQNGDSLFIDCGTTTMQLAKHLQAKKVTVITNSLVVSNLLQTNSKIKLIMAPGVYDPKSAGFLGPLTIDFLQKFNVDKAFIGAQGFDSESGATVPDEIDAEVKKAFCRNSKQRILMVGYEKLGVSCLAKFADITEIDCLISDENASRDEVGFILGKGVQVILAR
ncbi:DeoR/GlpR family DNA-binding transcription regulator [Hydrogenispora ethanolica]|uniref:DeoR/GlpR family DNA-binding transcription regulator n=1 Tax=Hydrogenispora ethanolica TaxID=1082276 RepID=UPI001404571C|nr:DeoR/GlpR family DNA-binding transcription regulator [Hydrogenispora ethanolica]